jgi:hypothetical protein
MISGAIDDSGIDLFGRYRRVDLVRLEMGGLEQI